MSVHFKPKECAASSLCQGVHLWPERTMDHITLDSCLVSDTPPQNKEGICDALLLSVLSISDYQDTRYRESWTNSLKISAFVVPKRRYFYASKHCSFYPDQWAVFSKELLCDKYTYLYMYVYMYKLIYSSQWPQEISTILISVSTKVLMIQVNQEIRILENCEVAQFSSLGNISKYVKCFLI